MSSRIPPPMIYGGVFGTLAGGVGIVQIIVVVRDFAAQNRAFAKRFPPGYTGFKDATNLVRGGEFDFMGTAFEALGVIAILMAIAATITVVATRRSAATRRTHMGVATTLIAGAVCAVIYVAASAIAISTGQHPLVPSDNVLLSDVPPCFSIFTITLFAIAWVTGMIGESLGALIGRRFLAESQ